MPSSFKGLRMSTQGERPSMQKQLQLCLYIVIVALNCLWHSLSLEASQPFKDEHKEDKASSIILKLPSSIDTRQALHSHKSPSQSQLFPGNNDITHSIKKHQDNLQGVILKSLQARPDALSPLVAQMKEALAALPDASKRILRQRQAFLLDPSLSSYSPFGFLRRKDKLLTEVILNPQHLSFERLREVMAHLDTLAKNEETILPPSLTSSLQKLKGVYETFIADLCSLSVDKRSSFLSSIPIDGEFFYMPFVIAQEQAYDLLSFDEYGIPFKNNLLGSSVVTKVGGIHAKSTLIKANQEGTLDPGMEWALSSFHTMLFGEGLVPSSLLILRDVPHQVALSGEEAEALVREAQDPNISRTDKKRILDRLHEDESLKNQFQRTTQSFAVQVTPHIEGIHLATFLEDALKDPSLWDTLDLYNVQSLLLTAFLTSPNDAKGDNFMVIREEIKESERSIKVTHKIIGIDNDRAFYPYIKAINPQAHLIDIRHILFCFPQVMSLPLIQKVKDDFLSHHPALFLLNWLKVLDQHNDKYQQLLTQGRIPQDLFDTLHLPFKLKQGTATSLLKRYTTLYDTLKLHHKAYITPDQLLEAVSPLTAQYYTNLRQAHGSFKAFDLIYRQTHTLEEVLKQEILRSNASNNTNQISPSEENIFSNFTNQDQFIQNVTNEGLHEFTVLNEEYKAQTVRIEQEETIQQAIVKILNNIDLQQLPPLNRKQVLEKAFLSYQELVSQAQHPQWRSPYLVHEGLKHKEALFSLPFLKTLINKFPESLRMLDEEQGYAPLHYAIENGVDPSVLEFLLRAGADGNQRITPKIGSSLTPLDFACVKNKGDAFKLLIEHGATQGSASLALRFYENLSASPSPSNLSSFLTLVSKHQELEWLLCLDHLLPSQGEGVMLRTTTQGERFILNAYRLLQLKNKIPLSELTNKIIDTKGNIINVMPEGRHPVGRLSLPFHTLQLSLYFKEYPELPGLEEAVASLMRMTFGFGAPYSELIKLESKPVLVSQGIHGRTLKAVLKDTPSHLKTLDAYSTSSLILLSMLINPEDGKPDNYILEERPEGNRLIAIDNDYAFVRAVAKNKVIGRPVVQVKTILYCLDQMQDKVHPQAREQFLKLNIGEVLESWLRHLRALNAQYHELFTEQERIKFMKEKECYIGIPFQEGAIKELYQKMNRLQSLLHDKPHLTHLELLCQLEPYLGKRYKPAFESPLSVQARFDLIDKPFFSKDGKTITSSGHILSSMNIPLQESLLEAAKKDLNKDKDYRPNKALEELKAIQRENIEAILKKQGISKLNLTNLKGVKLEDNLSQVLKKIDFKSIPEVDQKALFELLKQRPFTMLALKYADALSNQFIQQHIMFDYIKELNLTGCINLTDDIVPLIAEKAIALESLNLSYLPKLRNFTRSSFFGKQEPYIFNSLRSLNLSHCEELKILKLNAPALERLKLEGCMNVKSFTFAKMPSLKHIDLRHMKIIDPLMLDALIDASAENLKTLKLEGCHQIKDKEIWEVFPELMRKYRNMIQEFKEDIKAHLLGIETLEELYISNKYYIVDIKTICNIITEICRQINTIKSLNLWLMEIEDKGAIIISNSLNFMNLVCLNLANNNIGYNGASAISRSLNFITLTSLDLRDNIIGDDGVIAISKSSTLTNLTSLNLRNNKIGIKGAKAISQSLPLVNLTSLNLRSNNIGPNGAIAISHSSTLKNLLSLDLEGNNIKDNGASAISRSLTLTNLNLLNLVFNSIGDESAIAISHSSTLKNLLSLNLGYNNIGDKGVNAISKSSTLTNLTSLNLRNNNIRDEGKKAIKESEMLTKLKCLHL